MNQQMLFWTCVKLSCCFVFLMVLFLMTEQSKVYCHTIVDSQCKQLQNIIIFGYFCFESETLLTNQAVKKVPLEFVPDCVFLSHYTHRIVLVEVQPGRLDLL